MSNNEETSHIMFFKEQVLRFAAAIKHRHSTDDIDGINNYSRKPHASSGTEHGKGTSSVYGHVKVNDTVEGESVTDDMPVSSAGIKTYVAEKITELDTSLRAALQPKLNIVTSITKNSTNSQIPTALAVWNALISYKDLLIGVDLARPQSINKNLNEMVDAGYFKQTGHRHFSYGGETIYYTNALIKIEKQANRVIQHVYATSPVTSGGKTTYKVNGCEYTRWGSSTTNWGAWHCAHKPYTKTTRAKNWGPGVDSNSVVVYENTAGFIIHWDQYKQDNDKYPISANLYEYAKVCEFNPPLPIKGPYVFGNLIGRMDIRITSSKMEIRSNVSKGGRIIGMHETYFVPRNQ